jgi:hypothetical protein
MAIYKHVDRATSSKRDRNASDKSLPGGQKSENCESWNINALSEVGEHWIERYRHFLAPRPKPLARNKYLQTKFVHFYKKAFKIPVVARQTAG